MTASPASLHIPERFFLCAKWNTLHNESEVSRKPLYSHDIYFITICSGKKCALCQFKFYWFSKSLDSKYLEVTKTAART